MPLFPTINKYYAVDTKFEDKFDLRYCFDCVVAETNMLIDETGNDELMMEETECHVYNIHFHTWLILFLRLHLHRDDDSLGLNLEDELDEIGDDED